MVTLQSLNLIFSTWVEKEPERIKQNKQTSLKRTEKLHAESEFNWNILFAGKWLLFYNLPNTNITFIFYFSNNKNVPHLLSGCPQNSESFAISKMHTFSLGTVSPPLPRMTCLVSCVICHWSDLLHQTLWSSTRGDSGGQASCSHLIDSPPRGYLYVVS